MALSLSEYYDISCYAGASLALYSIASIAVRGGGRVKPALVNVSGLMLQRAFWATVRGGGVDWLYEACYWLSAFIVSILVSALDACLEAAMRRWEERVSVPQPRRVRGGRRPLV